MSSLPHIIFDLHPGSEAAFALDVGAITQVVEVDGPFVGVPLAPSSVRGIINHNGRIITVVDPSPLLGLPPQAGKSAHVLLLRHEGRSRGNLGLLVRRIREIAPRPALEQVDVEGGPCISWVAHVKRRLVHVVDVEPLLQGLSQLFGPAVSGELSGVEG